jgi:hypothetical protein
MGVDLNLFSLFSLAEHIVFAISAIPYAAIFLMVIFFTLRAIVHMTDTNFLPFSLKLFFVFGSLVSLAIIIFYKELGAAGLGFLVPAAGLLLLDVLFRVGISRSQYVIAIACFSLICTLVTGFVIGRGYPGNLSGPSLYKVTTKAKEFLGVKIIRSGDRGLLFLMPPSNKLELIPWSEITSIETAVLK